MGLTQCFADRFTFLFNAQLNFQFFVKAALKTTLTKEVGLFINIIFSDLEIVLLLVNVTVRTIIVLVLKVLKSLLLVE